MTSKPRPNRRAYLEVLKRMTPEQRVQKSFELSEFTKQLYMDGLRDRFPHLDETELRQVYLRRLERCHNWNY